ncbi:hypothetical protein OROHE_022699 [Orobanche hederae]
MLNDQRALTITNTRSINNPNNLDQENLDHQDDDRDRDHDRRSPIIRDIHALTPPRAPRAPLIRRSSSHSRASSSSSSPTTTTTDGGGDNFTSMSREFNALVLAGSAIGHEPSPSNLDRIMEEENPDEETNPLAVVLPDNHPHGPPGALGTTTGSDSYIGEVSVQHVKKEEVESKIGAWQNAKIAKINNRFKREDAVINGWEDEQVHKASSWMKKIERKLEEKRAKAHEKMQNEIAKAHRKAEERRASAEAKRGIKVARVLEVANLMRVVGRAPVKHSFF